ncbi:hypothetical protein A6P39_044250 (plasmid) [Streptomyces sp. FXJ1.172]|uniref:hypothetical protein n=1 Tax=Streptomyces sp. FXJ1.172 TaxID=710705 RepID=UPI0023DD2A07|nr:hypothetical protein [Streptomyces sp. FXJ1.172]WEP00721.1 hypothetical protein A6P39_044250 [Streptomyces sp. FXJ1.172]
MLAEDPLVGHAVGGPLGKGGDRQLDVVAFDLLLGEFLDVSAQSLVVGEDQDADRAVDEAVTAAPLPVPDGELQPVEGSGGLAALRGTPDDEHPGL